MVKLTALLMMLVMLLGMACGCTTSIYDEGEEQIIYEVTIGIPYKENSDQWKAMENLLKDPEEGFEFFNNADVTLVSVPASGTEEYKKFLDSFSKNKVDMFLAPPSPEIEELIEDGRLLSYDSLYSKDNSLFDGCLPYARALSAEECNRTSYAVPYTGVYQGLFINKAVFASAGVTIPEKWDWASFTAAIDQLKAAGVTPFAAGFADETGYWLDELIYAKGGHSQHSTPPSKGVINGWNDAVKQFKAFYDQGIFTATALTDTHGAAVSQFLSGHAAMILASSTEIDGQLNETAITYMAFPAMPDGLKNEGAIIGHSVYNFYFNSKTFGKVFDASMNMSGLLKTLIVDYLINSNYYANFAVNGGFPFSTAAEDALDSEFKTAAYEVLKNAPEADQPMDHYLLTFENMESKIVSVLTGEISADDYLSDISAVEIKAQADKRQAEKEEKDD